MSNIFVTSDTHFGHNRDFVWKARGFESVEEMNQAIVQRWNSVVAFEDTVYHLGDVMLGGDNTAGLELLKQLNGTIHIIAGNHDTPTRIKLYQEAGFTVEYATVLKYKKYSFYLSHYPTITDNGEITSLRQGMCNLFGHTHQESNFYNQNPLMYHVGMDSHDCYPVNLDNIIYEMNNNFYE